MNNELFCSFCGKSARAIERLITGHNNVCICNECIKLCMKIISDYKNRDTLARIEQEKFMELWGTDV